MVPGGPRTHDSADAMSPSRSPDLPAFEVRRRRRRTAGIMVRPDGGVEIHAPLRWSHQQIEQVVEENREWIVQKRRENRERWRRLRARRFDEGDEIPYLGGVLRLRIEEAAVDGLVPPRREGDDLFVGVPGGLNTPARRPVVRYAVGRWLLDEARTVFHRRHVRAAKRVGETAESVTIKDMRSRWGSCGPQRRMSLNWRLILAPVEVIDYVLCHELVHIRVPDHSERFWRRVERAMPDYRVHRDWLRDHGAELEL